jgi:hypothetical protein
MRGKSFAPEQRCFFSSVPFRFSCLLLLAVLFFCFNGSRGRHQVSYGWGVLLVCGVPVHAPPPENAQLQHAVVRVLADEGEAPVAASWRLVIGHDRVHVLLVV